MLISTQHKFVFFGMEKCASNSIEGMLSPHCEISLLGRPEFRHANFRQYEKYLRPWLAQFVDTGALETICIAREPVSWLGSWHRFRSRPELRDPAHPNHHNCTFGISFEAFVEAWLSDTPPPFARVGRQFDLVRDASGAPGVGSVFAYEALDEFVDCMSARVGARLTLGHRNVSPADAGAPRLLALAGALRARLADRLAGNLPAGAASAVRPGSSGTPTLPPDLLARLQAAAPRDFELHARARGAQ